MNEQQLVVAAGVAGGGAQRLQRHRYHSITNLLALNRTDSLLVKLAAAVVVVELQDQAKVRQMSVQDLRSFVD
jgi:hypothetical protein